MDLDKFVRMAAGPLRVLGLALLALGAFSATAQAQIPPTVIPFIDLKCYGITDPNGLPLPPLNFPLHLDHLNPLLRPPVAPPEDVILQDPQQLCVPVAKNGQFPPPPDSPVISQIDLKCYAIVDRTTGLPGDPLNLPQTLFHLNPVLRDQPPEPVLIQEPQQLCVPVQKSRPPPPMVPSVKKRAARIVALARIFDFKFADSGAVLLISGDGLP